MEVLITFDHAIGDQVVFCPFNLDHPVFGSVKGVHSYGTTEEDRLKTTKKKYDLELHGPGGQKTRIYLVDGIHVKSVKDYSEAIKGQEFRIASLPLRKFMQHYPNPHASVIVTSEHAELLEGVKVAPNHLPADAT